MHFWEWWGAPEAAAPASAPLPACGTAHRDALCAECLANALAALCCKLLIFATICARFQLQKRRVALAVLGAGDGRCWVDDAETSPALGAAPRLAGTTCPQILAVSQAFSQLPFSHAGRGHERSGVIRNVFACASSPA